MEESLKYRISLEDLFSKGIQTAEGHATKFEHAIEHTKEKISELGKELIAAAGIFETLEFGKESIQDFLKLEAATTRLQFTVGQRGGLASDFKELTEESEKLGESSFFNDREIQEAANRLLNFGVSVNQTKDSLKALTDVGLAKGKSLDEVISAVGMAAAGGRAMALKEYGLGFIKLEKDMSVAGAEARNFNKIIDAMGSKFGGATDAMKNTEFFKIKKWQDELEDFRESVGKNLLHVFDKMLPYLKDAIEFFKELGHWIKELWVDIKALAVSFGAAYAALFLYSNRVLIATAASEAYAFVEGVVMADALDVATIAQNALNAAMDLNPVGILIVGVAALAGAWYEAANAEEEYENARNKDLHQAVTDEIDLVDKLTESILKKNEANKMTFDDARKIAIDAERNNLNDLIKTTKEQIDFLEETKREGTSTKEDETNYLALQKSLTNYMAQKNALYKMPIGKEHKGEVGAQGDDGLGSGLSEPKQSKIQNITININNPFNNQKVTMGGGSLDVKELAPKFTEYLISLVEDASIVATE